jgi:hypothetical protein
VNGLGVHANPAVTGAAAWARAVAPRAGRAVEDTVVAATGTEGTPKVGVDVDALTTGRTRGPGTTTPTDDDADDGRVCTVVAARCAAVREALAEDPAADDEGEDAELSTGVLSAAATPAPASAAPTLSRPAPTHAYG